MSTTNKNTALSAIGRVLLLPLADRELYGYDDAWSAGYNDAMGDVRDAIFDHYDPASYFPDFYDDEEKVSDDILHNF